MPFTAGKKKLALPTPASRWSKKYSGQKWRVNFQLRPKRGKRISLLIISQAHEFVSSHSLQGVQEENRQQPETAFCVRYLLHRSTFSHSSRFSSRCGAFPALFFAAFSPISQTQLMLSDLLTSFIELDETNNSSQGNEAVVYKIKFSDLSTFHLVT